MPLYEYECQKCKTRSEVLRKFSDPALTTCDQCGGELKKLISSPAIQFKGSGFYINDYARSGGSSEGSKVSKADGKRDSAESKSGSSSDSGGDSGSASGSDSKTASSTETKTASGTDKGESSSASKPASAGGSKNDSTPA